MVDESSKDDLKSQAAPNLASGLSYAYDKPDESTKVRVHYNPPPFPGKRDITMDVLQGGYSVSCQAASKKIRAL